MTAPVRLSRRPTLVLLCVAFAMLGASGVPAAQEAGASSGQEGDSRPRFSTSVGMTRVKAAVVDSEGEPVGGLGVGDFRVWENGVEQPIEMVLDPVRFSLDVAMVLDFSASIANDWSTSDARSAIHDFLDRLGDDDCVFMLPFNSNVGPGIWGGPDDVPLRQTVDEHKFELYTRLYDALLVGHDALDRRRPDSASAAAEELDDTLYGTWMEPIGASACGDPLDPEEARDRRAAMVVLTDGADSGSLAGYTDALLATWRSEVPVFAMGVGLAAEPPRRRTSSSLTQRRDPRRREMYEAILSLQDQLREIARVSGGQLILQKDLRDGYATTLGLLRGYYVLTYRSPDDVADGWQEVDVELTNSRADVVVQPGVYRGDSSHVGAVEILREADVKFTLGQYEEALADFDLVARFTPGVGAPHFGRGLALEMLERYDEAADAFARSLELRPGTPSTHAKLAEAAARSGDHAVAWEHGLRAHVAGLNQVELFRQLEAESTAPGDLRERLVAPVVFVMRPRVPELDAQLALRHVSHVLLTGLDTSPHAAVTTDIAYADFSINLWVRNLGDDGDLTARLVIHDLLQGDRREQGFSIDDVGDADQVAATVAEALLEAREWMDERHGTE
ncbi:MAG: VWA domain-containing protein [Acidobacteria bacterium]|nr:VWA domain-containing protein [Acidobacteriota bacterium]